MKIVIIGAGPCGLFLSHQLLLKGHEVHLYEKTSGAGKKLLVAGKSGLNITNARPHQEMATQYLDNIAHFKNCFKQFSNNDLIKYLEGLGVETFSSRSKRVFPKEMKAARLLSLINQELRSFKDFYFYKEHTLTSIESDFVIINDKKVKFDRIVYALGGASWKKLGTDGQWSELFQKKGITINPFYPVNCGYEVKWKTKVYSESTTHALKDIALSYKGQSERGDLSLTAYGIEGGPLYPLTLELTKDFNQGMELILSIDLLPQLSTAQIKEKLTQKREKDSLSNALRKKLKLSKHKMQVFKELTQKGLSDDDLIHSLKNLTLKLQGPRPIDEAISTGGGVDMSEITDSFELKKLSGHYALGEMLDWVAPTGGYLLQACFSQAYSLSVDLNKKP